MPGIPTIQPAKTTEYETPRELFDSLFEEVGGFDLDPCCRPDHYTAQCVLAAGGEIMIPPRPPSAPGGPTIQGPAGHVRTYYDGLKMPWQGKVYMNPPYGPALRQWVPKAVHEVECGNAELVMALLPAKTEVQWWQEYVMTRFVDPWQSCCQRAEDRGSRWHPLVREVRFIKGRLSFGGADGGPARVGNVIVVWRK